MTKICKILQNLIFFIKNRITLNPVLHEGRLAAGEASKENIQQFKDKIFLIFFFSV
jgi:hypothetical protein